MYGSRNERTLQSRWMLKKSSRLYAKNWEAVGTGENLLNQKVDKEMYREIYLTDRQEI